MEGSEKRSLRRDAASGVAWSTIQAIGTRVISLAVFLVLARLLTPQAFGLVSLASVFVTLLSVFVEQGFAQAIIQREDLLAEHLDSAFWSCVGMGAVMTVAAYFLAAPIADILGEPKLTPILQALSPSLFLTGLASTAEAVLRRQMEFRSLAMRTMFGAAAGGAVGLAAAIAGAGAWSLVYQLLAQAIVETMVIWVAVSWRPGLSVTWVAFKDLFAFSVNVVGINILNFLNRQSDDLLIAGVLGTTALGYYSVAYRILLMLTEVMTRTIDAVTLPTFSRVQKDVERLRSAYLMATRISSSIATPVFLALAALAPEIIPVFFGPQWEASVPVMQILSFIGLLHAAIYFSGNVLLAIGQPRRALLISVANASSNVVAFAIAAHWGIEAVAAAYVIRGYLLSPLPVALVKHALGFAWRDYLRVTLVPLGCAGIMVGVMVALRPLIAPFTDDATRLLILAACGPPVYIVAMRTLAGRYVAQAAAYMAPASPLLSRLLLWSPSS
jgi:O-antigen/teichoic acid export membrane protein